MKLSSGLRVTFAALSIALGTATAALPEDWIERRFGVSPDNGNGLLEFLLVAVPFAIAALLLLSLARRYHRSAARN